MRKIWITAAVVAVLALAGMTVWLFLSLQEQKEANQEMQELAELDKQEMENEYERFTLQYSEMMTQINNDSIVAQLTQEQLRTQKLLEELKQVKANDAREITRLKKELATVREVLRSYIRQVDSLNQVNMALRDENSQIKSELEETNRTAQVLQTEKASLSEKVAIAAQLDATGIMMTPLNKRDKAAKKMKDARQLQVSFTISRNVTATNGTRTLFVRIQTPGGTVLNGGGTFAYENRQLEYSMRKAVEYTGEETPVTTYWNVNEFLDGGDYRVSIFADGNMIGSKTFSFK
jgi:myosin heavy subunit